ncbi:DUF1697 domain-containing protein [Tabrizicola sp.]|jgi:uncharacterized protein (DUF1697 family)|uniref:DUF1697 domain-containing protein n=1 Tax=Tabrizicola sp. TaxID=2005166 RepID=UPI0035B04CCF
MATCVVLLRGIGPATHAKLTMTALAEGCRAAGLADTVNLLATGNLIVRSDLSAAKVEAIVLDVLLAAGVSTKAVTCAARRIAALPRLCPDEEACRDRPARVEVVFLSQPLTDTALTLLRDRAGSERVARIGTDLWIDFAEGIVGSRLTIPVIERVTKSVATGRNWNTVMRLVRHLQ